MESKSITVRWHEGSAAIFEHDYIDLVNANVSCSAFVLNAAPFDIRTLTAFMLAMNPDVELEKGDRLLMRKLLAPIQRFFQDKGDDDNEDTYG